jgi:hypothetical protein
VESGGNPLAILELAADDDPVRPLPVAPLPATGRLEEHFRGLIRTLPERTRLALLIAAADDRSELRSFSDAAARLGLHAGDLELAEHRNLVRVTAGAVEFRHPLIRASAYQDAPLARRVAAHGALAVTLSDPRDADRRAWHLAVAATLDHVEAAVRTGDVDRARTYLPRLADWAKHAASPAASALVLRCEALLSDGMGAFEAALRVDGCGPYDRARTRLAYGEWLRRNRRPTSARSQLVEAS